MSDKLEITEEELAGFVYERLCASVPAHYGAMGTDFAAITKDANRIARWMLAALEGDGPEPGSVAKLVKAAQSCLLTNKQYAPKLLSYAEIHERFNRLNDALKPFGKGE